MPTASRVPSLAVNVDLPPVPSANLRLGYTYMVIALLCFVGNSLLIHWSGDLPGADTWIAVTCRYVVGLTIVLALFLPGSRLQLAKMVENPLLIVRGLLGGVAIYIFYYTLPILGAGRATVINCGYILFAAMLAGPMLGERLSAVKGAWLAAGCLGIAILCSRAGSAGAGISLMDVLAVLGALMAAGVVITIRQLSGSQHFSTIFAAQCFFGLMISAVPAGRSLAQPTPLAWAVMLGGGVLAAAGQLSMTRAYRDLSVAKGSAVQMLLPVLVAIGGALIFHERFTFIEMMGGALALIACWQVLSAGNTRRRPVPVEE